MPWVSSVGPTYVNRSNRRCPRESANGWEVLAANLCQHQNRLIVRFWMKWALAARLLTGICTAMGNLSARRILSAKGDKWGQVFSSCDIHRGPVHHTRETPNATVQMLLDLIIGLS